MTRLRIFLVAFGLLLLGSPVLAQSLIVVNDLHQFSIASALAMYENEFGKYKKPLADVTFPYAVVRMNLKGNEHAVNLAKERITLYMGQQTSVTEKCTAYSDQILFLVPACRAMIYIDCGYGCELVQLSNMLQLKSNCVYDCTVHFLPEIEETPDVDTVIVIEYQECINVEDSVVGWLSISSDSVDLQGLSAELKAKDIKGKQGKIKIDLPAQQEALNAGTYDVVIKKRKYNAYKDTVIIVGDSITTISPIFELMLLIVVSALSKRLFADWTLLMSSAVIPLFKTAICSVVKASCLAPINAAYPSYSATLSAVIPDFIASEFWMFEIFSSACVILFVRFDTALSLDVL